MDHKLAPIDMPEMSHSELDVKFQIKLRVRDLSFRAQRHER